MSYQVCHEHNKVSAWGCPVCRSEALEIACNEAVEETVRAMRAAFRNALANKDTRHDV